MHPKIMHYPFGTSTRSNGTLLILFICLLPIPLLGAENLDSIQEAARKWVDIRMETSRLESDWQWQKELLGSMQETLSFKVRQLEEKEALLLAQTATQREAVEKTRGDVAQLREELAMVAGHLQMIVDDLNQLRPSLPPTLSNGLELAFTSLSDPDQSLGEKMQLVVTVLNRCQQFNDMIAYREEVVRVEENSQETVMSVIYWGLSHAYALERTTGDTYMGKPTGSGWAWRPYPGIEDEIVHLINIFNEDSDPELVRVPVEVSLKELP